MGNVAVVVPVYNRIESLVRAVESILEQTVSVKEAIVVDDGSSVDLEAARSALEVPGVNWIDLGENRGVAAARNTGAKASQSEWLCFLDSDDLWLPRKLERQLQWHRENPEARISQVREEWVRGGKVVRKPGHWEQREGDLFAASIERCSISPSCVMIERSLWEELGPFDESFPVCEDYDLWLRITQSEPVGLVPGDPLVKKFGGYADQLSSAIPAMDRYRILALLKLLTADSLPESKVRQVRDGIVEKAGIVATGAEKRGDDERAMLYRSIGSYFQNDEETGLVDWINRVREELESSDSAGPA